MYMSFPILDIDECNEISACGFDAMCVNLLGSYECLCPEGYGGDPYNGACSPSQVS